MLDHNISYRMVVMIAVWINRTSAPANGRLLVCLNDVSIADVNAWVLLIRDSDEKKSDDVWEYHGSCISLLLYKTLESGSVYVSHFLLDLGLGYRLLLLWLFLLCISLLCIALLGISFLGIALLLGLFLLGFVFFFGRHPS